LDAVSLNCPSSHILGRLDVTSVTRYNGKLESAEMIRSLGIICQTLSTGFKYQNRDSPFTGVLLAHWQSNFSPIVCNELIKFINRLGLEVYLEVSGPDFLSDKDCRELNMVLIKGIIVRNASILEDGDRRNCFQMKKMQPILRAVAAQACIRDITLMMWETIPDNVPLDLAVAKRSYVWYKYFSAIPWIGPESALFDATVAYNQTVADEPLGALMWLKNDTIIDAQEVWRLNDTVRMTT
jgi:hypothetical protein